jgi:hypothetical protein
MYLKQHVQKVYLFREFFRKLVTIFLEDGKLESTMSFLFLGCGKMALDTWQLHHGGSILCDHMVSPKHSLNEAQSK